MVAMHHDLPSPLAVTVHDGQATVRVIGDLDVVSLPDLAEAVEVLAAQGVTRLVVDLAAAPRLDSRAVELLASVHARLCARGGRLRVTGASDPVEDLLHRRGLHGLLR